MRFPLQFNRQQLTQWLPQRGALFACQQLQVLDALNYVGTARWDADHACLDGHFPGQPMVPGILLIEAATQLAGAGLASAADATGQSTPARGIGVLARVRNASFRQAVLPGQNIEFAIRCRVRPGASVEVFADASYQGQAVAQLETLVVYRPISAT